MRVPFSFLKSSGGAPAWTPLDDAGSIGLLMLPGGYSITGTKGVDAVGTWVDESSNGNDAVSFSDATCPLAHADAWPVFVAAGTEFLVIDTSLDDVTYPADSIASPDDGGIVIVGKTTLLAAYAPNYVNAAFITGNGASPGAYLDDGGARLTSYTDSGSYMDAQQAGGVANTPAVVAIKWDALGMYASFGGAAWGTRTDYVAPDVSLSAGNIGANLWVGRSFTTYLGGDVRAIGIYSTAAELDAAKLAQWQAWAVAQGLV